MKREAAIHSKTGRLARALGIEHWGAIGILEALWHLTAREAPAGDIGKLSNEDIAYGVWWKSDPDQLVNALISCSWVDISEEHRLLIHDWTEHADDGVHQKLAKSLRFFADGSVPKLTKIPTNARESVEREFQRLKALKNSTVLSGEEKSSHQALPSQALPSQANHPLPSQGPGGPGGPPDKPRGSNQPKATAAVVTPFPTSQLPGAEERLADWSQPDVSEIAAGLASELHKQHLVPCDLGMAKMNAERELLKYPDPVKAANSMRETYAKHLGYWKAERARNPRYYVHHLHLWFSKGIYLQKEIHVEDQPFIPPKQTTYLRQRQEQLEREQSERERRAS